jgi:hypothetical protein
MQLRGNLPLFHWLTAISGALVLALCALFGDWGLAGAALFFLGMILTLEANTDEREMQLTYKVQSLHGIPVGVVLGLVYFYFPSVNWFHAFLGAGLLSQGVIGIIVFARQ